MPKVNLESVTTPLNSSEFQGQINRNFEKIQNSLDKQLQRDLPEGVSNVMETVLDMNSYRIINLGKPVNPSDAARVKELQDAVAEVKEEGERIIAKAEEEANRAHDEANIATMAAADAESSEARAILAETNANNSARSAEESKTSAANSANAAANSARDAESSKEEAARIIASIGPVMRYRGTVATYNDLPQTGNTVGDVWNILDDGSNYAWKEDGGWDRLSGVVDLSGYQEKLVEGHLITISPENIISVTGDTILHRSETSLNIWDIEAGSYIFDNPCTITLGNTATSVGGLQFTAGSRMYVQVRDGIWNWFAMSADQLEKGVTTKTGTNTYEGSYEVLNVLKVDGTSISKEEDGTISVIEYDKIVKNNVASSLNYAIGSSASINTSYANQIAIGPSSSVTGYSGIAIGNSAKAAQSSVAIGGVYSGGSAAQATGVQSVALGITATSSGSNSVAAGMNARATNSEAIAIGQSSNASGSASIAIGQSSNATQTRSVALGASSEATGSGSTALGGRATASGNSAVAVGYDSNCTGIRAIQLGADATNTENGSLYVALGDFEGVSTTTTNYKLLGSDGKIPADRLPASAQGKDIHGIRADYALTNGIISAPNGVMDYTTGTMDVTTGAGLVIMTSPDRQKTTITTSLTATLTSTEDVIMFIADGQLLEVHAQDVFYQEEEPENGETGFLAWWNPTSITKKWQFKSNDTGNVWRETDSTTPIAYVHIADGVITRIDHAGYMIIDDPVPTLAGNNTFTGNLGLVDNNFNIRTTKYTSDTAPTESSSSGLGFLGSDGSICGYALWGKETNGNSLLNIISRNGVSGKTVDSYVRLQSRADGVAYVQVPTPPAGSDSNVAATTEWVRDEFVSTAQLQTGVISNPLTAKCSVADGVFTDEVGSISIFPYGKGTPTLNVGDDFNGWGRIVKRFTRSSGEIFYWVKRYTTKTISSMGSSSGESAFFNRDTGAYNKASINYIYSGSTEPTTQLSGSCWYDTTNNYIKFSDGTTYSGIYSLPLCQLSLSSGVPQLITKRFASIGYIGTTFWVGSEVVVLAPNGKTDDGLYKYTRSTVSGIHLRTLTTAEAALGKIIPVWIPATNSLGFGSNFEIVDNINNRKTTQGYAWALDENKVYVNNKTTTRSQAPLAVFRTSGNYISDFDEFNTYSAVNYEFMRTGIIPTIIDTYSDTSGNWYRLYSDGWCEQGGLHTAGNLNVALLVPYNNTYYNVQLTAQSSGSGFTPTYNTKLVNVFSVHSGGAGTYPGNWVAKGYAF